MAVECHLAQLQGPMRLATDSSSECVESAGCGQELPRSFRVPELHEKAVRSAELDARHIRAGYPDHRRATDRDPHLCGHEEVADPAATEKEEAKEREKGWRQEKQCVGEIGRSGFDGDIESWNDDEQEANSKPAAHGKLHHDGQGLQPSSVHRGPSRRLHHGREHEPSGAEKPVRVAVEKGKEAGCSALSGIEHASIDGRIAKKSRKEEEKN